MDAVPDKYLVIVGALAKLEEVKGVTTSTGDHMIMVELWTRNNRELTDIVLQKNRQAWGRHKDFPSDCLGKDKVVRYA